MKYKWLSILFLWGAWAACEDDAAVFEASVPAEGITFAPVNGGAVMRYALPKNTDIYAVRVRYVNEQGEEQMKDGSVYGDSLVLSGFNAPRQEVVARITVVDRNNVESAPRERTFSTLPSAAYAVADSIRVENVWDGLRLKANYEGMPAGEGIDIFRVGINPFTKERDTLFLTNCKIAQRLNQFVEVVSDEDENTIVVKTVDANGYYVRTRVFPGVKILATEQYPRTKLAVSDPGNFSEERGSSNDYQVAGQLGIKYLIDGDVKGYGRLKNRKNYDFYTYMTKSDAKNSYVVLTLDEPRVIATVRLYAMLRTTSGNLPKPVANQADYTPSHVKVFGSNDLEQWDELSDFYQPNDSKWEVIWNSHTSIGDLTEENLDRADPVFMNLVCPTDGTEYKYVKVQCLDHFDYSVWNDQFRNFRNIFTYQELEVYVQKD